MDQWVIILVLGFWGAFNSLKNYFLMKRIAEIEDDCLLIRHDLCRLGLKFLEEGTP